MSHVSYAGTIETVEKMQPDNVQWMHKFSARDNILYGRHSYIPIVLEDIPKYIRLLDYEENCIKDVHTIGSIRKESTLELYLECITPNVKMKFPMKLQDISPKPHSSKTESPSLGNGGDVFRVFGTLRNINGVIMLDDCRLAPIEHPFDSLRLLSLQSRLARRQYKQFYRTPELDELLRTELGVMKSRNRFGRKRN